MTMPTKTLCPLALAGFILLALPACMNSTSAAADQAASPAAVDLGPSSRIASTGLAMPGAGHETHRTDTSSDGSFQLAHEDHSDAHAAGTVNSVDAAQHKINLSHQAIPALGWPPMTMDFPVARSVDLSRITPGSRVNFTLEKGKDGMYQVQSVQPAGSGR
jgi:Cu/Ag efflux protein CusF